MRLTRTESANNTTTINQTQITPKNANFDEIITIQKNLKMQNALRMVAHEDIGMDEFTNEPQP
jgi:hypothetical protein